MKYYRIYHLAIACVALGLTFSCTKKSSTTESSTDVGLAEAFPLGLSIASPTASSSTSSQALAEGKLAVTSTSTAAEKNTAVEAVLGGSSCAVSLNLLSADKADCYGPQVTYANHPSGHLNAPSGDLGIWDASVASGEACSADQLNKRLQGVSSMVDTGIFATAGLICAAKAAGSDLPAVGATLTLTTNMSGLVTVNGTALTISTATLARTTDDSDGNAVYVTTIVGTAGTNTYTIRVKHIPTSTDNSTYKGKLSIAIGDSTNFTQGNNCTNITGAAAGTTTGTSILYSKSATAVVYQLKNAQFCGNNVDPYVSSTDKTVDLTAKASNTNVDGWANNANYLLASYHPTTFVGTFKLAWQAGQNDGKTRTFNAVTTTNGGTAYFGFGADIAATTGVGDITGIHCNWLSGLASGVSTAKAQKQTMTVSSGKFVASTSNITFDPVDSCESSSSTFTVTPSGGTARAANTTTMDLVDVTEISSNISTVTAPTNVD